MFFKRAPKLDQLLRTALEHQQAGRVAEAEQLCRQILARQSDHADALHILGMLAAQGGRNDDAIILMRQAIAARPNYPEANVNLGNALNATGQLPQAIAAFRQATQLKPDFPEAFYNLGNALSQNRQLDEAIIAYQQAIALRPNYAIAHYNLGNALRQKHQPDQAIAAYREAIAYLPNYPAAYLNLGVVLVEIKQYTEAIAAYQQALALNRDYAEVYGNLGTALMKSGDYDQAMTAYRQAIALKPNDPGGYDNLGGILFQMAKFDEAVSAYRNALTRKPNYAEAHSNLLFTLNFHPGFDAPAIAAEARLWNQQHAEPLRPFIQPHANDRNPNRRLRVGYVSPDFWAQAESYFVVPLFEAHDQTQYEIHAYASVRRPDSVTDRLRRCASQWHDVLELDNAQLAEKIRHDRIDILVDLTMHMADNRLPLFAHKKPAPVQATWLAYPGTTGLKAIDYRITDPYMDPPSRDDAIYSEQSLRLPHSWCCYDPMSTAAPAPVKTAQAGRFIRFGSFNGFFKHNEPLLRLWAQVLIAVPNSRLLLQAPTGTPRDNIRQIFQSSGIDPQRIEFTGKCSRADYLRLYDAIDIALDPLPYNGITTTLDALWMGVPVISLTGNTAAGRAGLSLLSTIGLPELVAQKPEQFVQIACDLAQDASRLAELRSTLRQRLEQSPLMDYPRFARNMEAAYRQMWTNWCNK